MPTAALGFLRVRFVPVLLGFLAMLLVTLQSFALAVPPLEGRINDSAALLSQAAKQQLTGRLVAYEKTTGHQLAILTIPSLEGDPLEDFSIHVVEAWKLGKKSKDDGVLILVVSKDRKMRIEVGYGLEGDLPDAAAGRIVQDVMTPRFRSGDYEGGISAAVDAVIVKTGGQASTAVASDPLRKATPTRPLSLIGRIVLFFIKFAFFGLFGFFVLIMFIINSFGGRRSGGMFFGGGGFGGDTGGGFGDGGFTGGGGGFGGGGASGSW